MVAVQADANQVLDEADKAYLGFLAAREFTYDVDWVRIPVVDDRGRPVGPHRERT